MSEWVDEWVSGEGGTVGDCVYNVQYVHTCIHEALMLSI